MKTKCKATDDLDIAREVNAVVRERVRNPNARWKKALASIKVDHDREHKSGDGITFMTHPNDSYSENIPGRESTAQERLERLRYVLEHFTPTQVYDFRLEDFGLKTVIHYSENKPHRTFDRLPGLTEEVKDYEAIAFDWELLI